MRWFNKKPEEGDKKVQKKFLPPGHARGGAVKGHQHLVDRLFREVEKAKRVEKQHTSAILKQPDEAVAKALNVAQRAI